MTVAGICLVVMLQELEDAESSLPVQVAVSVIIKQYLKMECALI